MAKEEGVICIGCPLGCETRLTLNDKGEIVKISGNKCKEGEKYVLEEHRNPSRVLTATVLVEASVRNLLPVRTNRPVPKNQLKECMYIVAKIRVKPPTKREQVIVPNILNTGADLVATDELLA